MTSAPSDSVFTASDTRAKDEQGTPFSEQSGGPIALKILIAGGFGVGKTTLVGAISEVRPLRTEEQLTDAGAGVDDLSGIERKATTTVAMDFGRITFPDGITLYLFGTPGQERFWFMWRDMVYGAIGAVVLADTRRLADSFSAIDFFEQRNTPFIIAVNCFDGTRRYPIDKIRTALDLDEQVPIMLCDVRRRESVKQVLTTLVQHAFNEDTR
ncbi:ATP-binding protein [Actinomadura sp. LD22]|uniref:ATP-binding protein n=1 Tax=Actinomadura physcomitrii TaxID=2650748 RepID=A0A6I4MAZ4_9ACTN|nr:ATP/GTP-binding protein [Actinomadura physcomitrii]MWA01575.1 ATP-binding protein [Actinomadura physcomitrii]